MRNSDLIIRLSQVSGLSTSDVRSICINAPKMYKTYDVYKADGVSTREIAHPAREVKILQRVFLDEILSGLPIHDCATAYRPGRSLVDNVKPHVANGPVLKMDFRKFFPSFKGLDWQSYCRESGILVDEEDIHLSESLLFRRAAKGRPLELAIGAPSSPTISNILMYKFDELVFQRAGEQYVTYTRYADDLTFSAPRTGFLQGIQSIVARTVREIKHPSLTIHPDKTRFVTTKFGRHVTGLTISLDGRVTAGQYRKRQIRAGLHKFAKGDLDQDQAARLAGLLAFVSSVEPDYLAKLKDRYGGAIVEQLQAVAIKRTGTGRVNPLPPRRR